MNPHVYQRRYSGAQGTEQQSVSPVSFWRALCTAKIHTAIAVAFVLFAAGSTAGMLAVAYPELSLGDSSVLASQPRHATAEVLGVSTGYAEVTIFQQDNLTLAVMPYDYNSTTGMWNYKVSWIRYPGRDGSIYINGNPFVSSASGTGQNYTGYTLSPATRYNIVFYAQASGQGVKVVNRSFVTLAAPAATVSLDVADIAGASTVTAQPHAAGTLVNDNGTVYVIGQDGKLGIPDVQTFSAHGYSFSDVVPANTADRALPQTGLLNSGSAGLSSRAGQQPQQVNSTTSTVGSLSQPVITGPNNIKAGSYNSYSFVAISPYGSIDYQVNWGDGSAFAGGANFSSGIAYTDYHIYSSAGSYTMTVTAKDAAGNLASNSLGITVTGPNQNTSAAGLQLSQASFSFTADQGSTAYQQQAMSFTNIGSAPISYQLTVDNQPAWFNTSFANGTLTASPGVPVGLGASVNPNGLSAGQYVSAIKISGNFANSPILIPVYLTINAKTTAPAQPTLSLNNFSLLPAIVGQAYSSNAITFNQTGNVPVTVKFSGLPSGIGLPQIGGGSPVVQSTTFSQFSQPQMIILGGTAVAAGNYPATITLTNQAGQTVSRQFTFTVNAAGSPVASSTPAATGLIQGYKVVMPGNVPASGSLGSVSVLIDGAGSVSANPYYFNNLAPGSSHTIMVSSNTGWSVGYTLCYNSTSCHNNAPIMSNFVTVTIPAAGGYADLWWHFYPIPPSPVVTPSPTSTPVSASLTANGSTNLTVSVGALIGYTWSSSGGISATSHYTVGPVPDKCNPSSMGPFTWIANTLNGGTSATIQSCQAGSTYTITYQVNVNGLAVLAPPLTIKVNP